MPDPDPDPKPEDTRAKQTQDQPKTQDQPISFEFSAFPDGVSWIVVVECDGERVGELTVGPAASEDEAIDQALNLIRMRVGNEEHTAREWADRQGGTQRKTVD